MPCTAAPSPLLTPDVRFSRIRRSQVPLPQACTRSCAAQTSQVHQPQTRQALIPRLSFRGAEGPLAPPPQVGDQPTPYVPIDPPHRLPRVAQAVVVRPAFQVPVQ